MFRSLRKGRSSVYLQHAHTGHSIGAEKFEAEIANGKLVLQFALRPVDANQRQDEGSLHEHSLQSITLDDSYVIEQLRSYVNAKGGQLKEWEIRILSKNKLFRFPAKVSHTKQHAYEALQFAVENSDA